MEDITIFKENDLWLHEQLENKDFREKYENKFVAVLNKKIIFCAETMDVLISHLNKIRVDITNVLVERVYPDNTIIFL